MIAARWHADEPGLVTLPSGRQVVGRGLRDRGARPDLALVLAARRPSLDAGTVEWLPWPDFGLPLRPASAREAILRAYESTAAMRVAVLCGHGNGRTGAVLAVLAAVDGVPPAAAVAWVRAAYRPRAVETPWQRAWVRRTALRLTAERSPAGTP